jgi:cytochrome c
MRARATSTLFVTAMVVFGLQMSGGHFTIEAWGRPSAPVAGVTQPSTTRRSVWDGIFTDAQAKRGKESYEYSCASCHLPSLDGDPGRDIPALYGEEFVNDWSKRSVKDLFEMIKKSMPADSPASLRAETYADIVAYLLQANEFPSGAQELTADVASREEIGIDKAPVK